MKKIIRVTEVQLVNKMKKIINEQVYKYLKQFFLKTADNLISIGGKSASFLDEIMGRATSSTNSIVRGGKTYIISKNSGLLIPTSQIDDAINDIINGDKTWDQVSNRFPTYLQDGTEFREPFAKIFRDPLNEPVKKMKLGSVGRAFMNMISESAKTWFVVNQIVGNYSGWKFHIYCTTLEEVGFLYEKLNGITKSWGAEFKLGSNVNLQAQLLNPQQTGKGATIYIPASVIKQGKQRDFLSDIYNAISDYPSEGAIYGDEMITPNIGYRYEFYKPVNSKIGVNGEEYKALYQSNRGSHNIPGQPDIF